MSAMEHASLQGPNIIRRLVEYFVVISPFAKEQTQPIPVEYDDDGKLSGSSLAKISHEMKFEASITTRYPVKDHKKNPLLHESIVSFCHPRDYIELKDEYCMPKIHYFVVTGGGGSMMYGVCLTVFEPLKVEVVDGKKTKFEEIFQPKCVCILSLYPYLVAFREYLTQLERMSKSGEMAVPLERFITNFCTEVPAPPSGSFEVQTTISNSVIKFWSPPYNQPIAWVSLPFSHLFECLDIENVITVWHAIVLERQVLFTSTQKSLLTTVCEILVSLLFPMKWAHAYIPLVPKCLVSILSSPMPFLCGVEKEYLNVAIQHLNDECIIVDIDKNLISFGPATPELPPIPREFQKMLNDTLRENVGVIFREARSLTKDHDFSDRGEHLPSDIKITSDAMWESKLSLYDESFHTSFIPDQGGENHLNGYFAEHKNDSTQTIWDAVQEAFMNVYVGLLYSYRQYLVFPSKDNQQRKEAGIFDSFGGAGFKSKQFLKSRRNEKRIFLKELINTQMFDEFITKRLYGSGASDVSFFDLAIDNYLQITEFSMEKLNSSSEIEENGSQSRPGSASSHTMKTLLKKVISDGKSKPILHSSVVRRRLKTIVAPEPSSENLPTTLSSIDCASISSKNLVDDETTATATITPLSSFESPEKNERDQAHSSNTSNTYKYTYTLFPSKFDEKMFGKPRPLPAAILAEYSRRKEDAAIFRKKGRKRLEIDTKNGSPEETTFTVFFIVITAIIGKEFQKISTSSNSMMDRTIMSTSNIRSSDDDSSEGDSSYSESKNVHLHFDSAVRLSKNDDAQPQLQDNSLQSRFLDPIFMSKLEEARSIAKAQLDLAFEMVKIMKQRNLTMSPVAYKCLIDACGRCGDTDRATDILKRMHNDGIVADGTVYSCLVAAFSTESTWRKALGKADLPEWTNGASAELGVDWNKLKNPINKSSRKEDDKGGNSFRKAIRGTALSRESSTNNISSNQLTAEPISPEKYVTSAIENQILFGENLLEMVYKEISIDTDDEKCPHCGNLLLDDVVVSGWTQGDSQDYTTTCNECKSNFVPKFCVQSSSDTFIGSKGIRTPLICERLSPWVLEKEIRIKMADWDGIGDLLDKTWREKEPKNAVLWWNLVLAFMRYKIPFTFLLQGNFKKNLIVPMPDINNGNGTLIQ